MCQMIRTHILLVLQIYQQIKKVPGSKERVNMPSNENFQLVFNPLLHMPFLDHDIIFFF